MMRNLNFMKRGKKNKKPLLVTALCIGLTFFQFSATIPDEGMFPLSDLDRAGLKTAGLKINEKDIYNPGKVGLVDALVRVGGCSGSFVSEDGLIITNHHCAFSAVQLASTPEKDYLTNGFIAPTKEQEIEAKGLPIRITESYEDVSKEVLGAVKNITDPVERIRVIQETMRNIVQKAEQEDPTIKAEVSEMFIGKSYVLFRYKTIEDVRLVYIPRQNIGEFGGETDNWVWPRHTGDFSFLRAYVAPDGSPAPYSKDNVPYKPKKHLKVNPKGVAEEDFVFILGYPGRTFRHRPAQYLEYQERFLLPYVSELNDFQNQQMMLAGKDDKAIELQLASRIKRNANVMKNYRGKMKGLRNLSLVDQKREEDLALANFIQNSSTLKAQYGTLMNDIDQFYKETFEDAKKELWFGQIYGSTNLLQVSRQLNDFKQGLSNIADAAQRKATFEANQTRLRQALRNMYNTFQVSVDQSILGRMLADASKFTGKDEISAVSNLYIQNEEEAFELAKQLIGNSKLADIDYVNNELLSDVDKFLAYEDDLMRFQKFLHQEFVQFREVQVRRDGVLNRLMGDYVAVKEQFQQKSFIPDANSTLRLTYGYIRGYSPADATYMKPFTTIEGLIQKGNTKEPEFDYPSIIKDKWLAKDFGPYKKDDLNDVPVNILYDMDTTGGNSGSPIMNAYGELIGVNFDRAYDATINDFAWNQSYSRSIGVDIRFVLWVADKVDGADFILKEMGVKN